MFDMDGTTVRHINPHLIGIMEFLDDLSFRISKWFSIKKPYTDFSLEKNRSSGLLVHRAIHRFRRKPVGQIVQPCPGILTLLTMLQKQNVPMGIVSNGLGAGYGYEILEQFHLNGFFKVKIFREDIQHSKPHPDPILRALKGFKDVGVDDTVWYIGDRHKDVMAALAANDILPATVVPFAYGLKAAIAILEKGLGPEQIIMNYTDFTGRIYPMLTEISAETNDWE